MMRRIPGGLLALSTAEDGTSAQVSWGRSRFTIQGHRAEDYPSIGAFPAGDHRTLPQGLLRRCISHTAFAAAQGETARALLTGVELRLGANGVFALATDGFQAAAYATHPNVGRPVDGAIVVPASVLTEVARLLDDSEEPCDVAQHGNHVMFRCGAVHLTARLLEGKYFDLLGLVPREFPTVVRVDRDTLVGACERVGIVAEAEAPHAVTMDLTSDGMKLTASRAEVGAAEEEVTALVSGPTMHMGFNVKQMIEGLRRFEGREVKLEISGPLSLTRWTDSDDGKFQYLQMPLQMPE
jgi:DNA polymerase-3 subunit beta